MNDSNASDSNGASAPVPVSVSGGVPASGSASSPIKQALAAIRDLRAQLDAAQARETEPIAIVGMACRYPGCADLASFWRLLVDGRDAVTEVPADRWSLDALYDPDPSRPGKMTSRWAGVIDRLDEFDAAFFGISPREAPHVDPRQRLSLELMWEALEHAGIPPDSLAGTLTGVFMATLTNDYDHLLFDDLRRADAYSGAGTANSIVANRLSYFLDVRGPSLALDTACSGSLVAVHLACESLRRGESTLALAGGVNVNLMPKSNVFFSKAGALSPSGRCKTFDGRADGMVRSDGAGMIVLKRLSDARRDGDRVIAVIKGSAVNHDGRSNGLMAPNGDAQKAVLTEAYRRAGVAPASVQYIEAHGTGTKLGDPIEVQALGDVLSADRPFDRKCLLGSLKTNVGHTEAAAGIGGLIKAALALGHRVIPPVVHFAEPNPLIPFDRLPFVVPREASAWPSPDAPLVAGVSGFGFGGTNAHVVLQDAASVVSAPSPAATVDAPPYLLACSARTPRALRELAGRLRDCLSARASDANAKASDANAKATGANAKAADASGKASDATGDICAAAALGRTHHRAQRLALASDSREGLLTALERRISEMDGVAADAASGAAASGAGVSGAAAAGAAARPGAGAAPAAATPAVTANGGGRLVFVFSGQGSHWPLMGQRLAMREPVFKAALDECDRLFTPLLKTSLVEEIAREANASRLNETALTQPAIFSMQIALLALWRSFGVTPDAVIGHSLGEVAAACAASVITLEEGVRIVYHRSRLMTRAAGHGRTIVVGLSFDDAGELVRPFEPALAVAGSNGPGTSVIAGDPASIAGLMRTLESRGTFCRAIQGVDIAFHSPQMDPLRDELVDVLSGDPATATPTAIAIVPRPAKIPIVSTVTGTWARGETFDATYWGRNLREPFLFARGIGVLLGDGGIRACIEVSPDAVLSSSIAQCARQAGQPSLPLLSSMRRATTDEPLHLFEQLARLYELGEPLQWRGIYPSGARQASLPTYPWQRQRFWFDQLTPAEASVTHVNAVVGRRDAPRVEATNGAHGSNLGRATHVTDALSGARATHGATDAASKDAHTLLGDAIEPASSGGADRVCLWQFEANAAHPAWIADHKVLGDVMVPGAAMLELAIAAARQVWPDAEGHADARRPSAEADTGADVTVPGAAMLELATAAARQLWASGDAGRVNAGPGAETIAGATAGAGVTTASIAVTGMTFDQPIRLDVPRLLQVTLTIRGGEADFTLHSRAAGSRDAWTKHATARVTASAVVAEHVAASHLAESAADRAARIGEAMSVDAHYAAMTADGLEYGPAFRGIQRLWATTEPGIAPLTGGRDDSTLCPSPRSSNGGAEGGRGSEGEDSSSVWGEAFAEIRLPSDVGEHDARYAMHPAMLDAAFQTVAAAVGRDDRQRYLPRGVAQWRVFDVVGDRVWCHVKVTARGPEGLTADIDVLNDDGRTLARVDGLSLVRFGAPRRNPLEDALLEERWQPSELAARTDTNRRDQPPRSWLILADGTGVGEALTARLRANGEQVTVARWGSAWRQHDAHIELRAGERGDMDRLLAAASVSGRIDHVVHLWSLDTRSPEAYSDGDTATIALDTAETRAVASTLHLAQALVQANSTARLWLTTRGTQAVYPPAAPPRTGSPTASMATVSMATASLSNASMTSVQPVSTPAVNLLAPNAFRVTNAIEIQQAAVNGLALTIGQEHPELRCTTIDLDGASRAPAQVTSLTAELLADDRETRVAWRRGTRYIARLAATPLPREAAALTAARGELGRPSTAGAETDTAFAGTPGTPTSAGVALPAPALSGDATYLITGGLGALGLRTAASLARLGARQLVLTGRRGIEGVSESAAASIRAIERTGATVTIARADVSIAADAENLFADVLSKLPPLRGVIHAAGVLDDALIAQQSFDRLRTVMAPKVRGTWNLHVHTRALPIDFFICYSSAASLVGSPGQANYAAGNASMDAIAHHRRALGLPASSINWGAWGEEGMAANPQMHARLAARGVTPIATSDGLALLSRLLSDTIASQPADADVAGDPVAAEADGGNVTETDTSDRVNSRRAAAERPAVFGVMPVAWGTFLKQFPAGAPSRFEMLAPASGQSDDASSSASSASSAAADSPNAASGAAAVLALHALTPADRGRRLQQMLRDTLAAVLGFGAPLELGPREKYFDLGMDSLLSVEFRNRLQQTFAIALPATLAFEYPTIETLAAHVDELLAERFRSGDSGNSGDSGDTAASPSSSQSQSASPSATGPAVIHPPVAQAPREGDDADALDVLPTDEIARLLAAELNEEAVRVR